MTDQELVAELLAFAGLGVPLSVERVKAGTLNRNFRVETREGSFFAREYRQGLPKSRIQEEHDLLAWCRERGLPVPTPMHLAPGTIVEIDGRAWSVFPWVEGISVPRGALTAKQAAALGEMHGRVQSVLATHSASAGATWLRRWNKADSLAAVTDLLAIARGRSAPGWMVDALELHLELLKAADILPFEHFPALPVQLVHGDFHDQQVLFGPSDEIVLIADWELFQPAPRAWELLRSLDFSVVLDTPLLGDYLAGYREHIQLSRDEAGLALEWWLQNRVLGTWTWQAYFVEGNDRVADLLPSTANQLRALATPGWRERTSERFIQLACG